MHKRRVDKEIMKNENDSSEYPDLSNRILINRIIHKFQVMFLCLGCNHRWHVVVGKNENLTEKECPKCGLKKSFPSFIPNNFYSEFEDEK